MTPYIVKRSSDLVKLKTALADLDGLEDQYSNLVRRHLRTRTNHKRSSGIFSNFRKPKSDTVVVQPPKKSDDNSIFKRFTSPEKVKRAVEPSNNDLY